MDQLKTLYIPFNAQHNVFTVVRNAKISRVFCMDSIHDEVSGGRNIRFRRVKQLSEIARSPRVNPEASLSSIDENTEPNALVRPLTRDIYSLGVRHRAASLRESAKLLPIDSRMDLKASLSSESRFSLMFTPGFSDTVNDTVRMARHRSILSDSYRQSDDARALFLRQVVDNRKGVDVVSLTRKLNHVNYLRVDFKDVLMFHPNAWGFPEAALNRTVIGPLGRERDPSYGWLRQNPNRFVADMEDVVFACSSTVRSIPKETIEAICCGKVPEWLQNVSELGIDALTLTKLQTRLGRGDWELRRLLEAGLVEPSKVIVKLRDLTHPRPFEPEALSIAANIKFNVQGVAGLRLYLEKRMGSNVQLPITPFQIDAVAFQLDIFREYHFYWVARFLLTLPVPFGWSVEIVNDVRTYVKLSSGHRQQTHPYIDQFREMAASLHMAQVIWDTRGIVNIPCDDCGRPDSVLFCLRCTGFMCVDCFLKAHKNRTDHWSYPYAGCRYLTAAEVEQLEPYLHLTNVGYCNRRRFLARTNQSDKTGSCQCEWMHFESIEAYNCIVSHSDIDRAIIRSIEEGKGFYFNFATGKTIDNPNYFLAKSKNEQAMALRLQASFRGYLARRRVTNLIQGAITIQKNVRMSLARRRYRLIGKGSPLWEWMQWYDLHRRRVRMVSGITKFQAIVRRIQVQAAYQIKKRSVSSIQALMRGFFVRRHMKKLTSSAVDIQRVWRGFYYGYCRVVRMHSAASCIQSVTRGILTRKRHGEETKAAIRIQALLRGWTSRRLSEVRHRSAVLIQSFWRRFVSIVESKLDFILRFQTIVRQYEDRVRLKAMRCACILIQKNVRRHFERKTFEKRKLFLRCLEKPLSSIIACFLLASCQSCRPLHSWIRYLPEQGRSRICSLKGIIQNGICRHSNGEGLAAAIVQTVLTRLLVAGNLKPDLSHRLVVSHSVCHKFAAATATRAAWLRSHHSSDDERGLIIEKIAYSTSSLSESAIVGVVLIPFREYLNQPRLKLDSRLAFQGVDGDVAFKIIDSIGSDLGLELPSLQLAGKPTCAELVRGITKWLGEADSVKPAISEAIAYQSDFRFVTKQQVYGLWKKIGQLCRTENGASFARHVTEIESVMEECRLSLAQEHHEYVACVVVLHIVFRGLVVRELWQRAARIIQTRFRYFQSRTKRMRLLKPAITIQRFWRGLRVALTMARKDRSATTIQRNYRVVQQRCRNSKLQISVLRIQSFWRGYAQRIFLRLANSSSILIQRCFRGHLVRLVLTSPEGKEVRSSFVERLKRVANHDQVYRQVELLAYRTALEQVRRNSLTTKQNRARIMQKKFDQYRRLTSGGSKGVPRRVSVFEPPTAAKRRELWLLGHSPLHTTDRSTVSNIVTEAESIIESLKRTFA